MILRTYEERTSYLNYTEVRVHIYIKNSLIYNLKILFTHIVYIYVCNYQK